jgi:hypothetical protein
MIGNKCEGKKNSGVALKFFMGCANFKVGRQKKEKKEMVFDTKSTTLLIHAPHTRAESIDIFQMLPLKAIFGGRITTYAPPE